MHGVDGDTALVETENGGGCGRCNEPGGCRSGLIAGMFAPGPRTYRIANTIRAQAGQRVLVCLPDGAVLRSAIAGYLVPSGVCWARCWAWRPRDRSRTALGDVTGLGLGLLSNLWWRGATAKHGAPLLEPGMGSTAVLINTHHDATPYVCPLLGCCSCVCRSHGAKRAPDSPKCEKQGLVVNIRTTSRDPQPCADPGR